MFKNKVSNFVRSQYGMALSGFVLFVFVVGLFIFPHYYNREVIVIDVLKSERIVSSSKDGQSSSKYLIFSKNETFENTDSLYEFKFNSSDIYGSIVPNSKYKVLVYGFRIPFLSWYRNIVSAEKID